MYYFLFHQNFNHFCVHFTIDPSKILIHFILQIKMDFDEAVRNVLFDEAMEPPTSYAQGLYTAGIPDTLAFMNDDLGDGDGIIESTHIAAQSTCTSAMAYLEER